MLNSGSRNYIKIIKLKELLHKISSSDCFYNWLRQINKGNKIDLIIFWVIRLENQKFLLKLNLKK